jgi:hypothetical protein
MGQRDEGDAFPAAGGGIRRDTSVCALGGHRIHRTPGGWADDDGDLFCLTAACADPYGDAAHEPVTVPQQGRR